jgi:hypothetical protein
MNEKQVVFHSSFIVPRSSFLFHPFQNFAPRRPESRRGAFSSDSRMACGTVHKWTILCFSRMGRVAGSVSRTRAAPSAPR